jgi:hypothetical protein
MNLKTYTYFSYKLNLSKDELGVHVRFQVPMATIESTIFQDMTEISEDSTLKESPTFKY